LKFDDEIVQAISLRKPLHKKDDCIEIARSCSTLNTTVVGGLSRLVHAIKTFAIEQRCPLLITYVDKRYGTGSSYENAGFELVGETIPRFWWTDSHKRYNRFKFRADARSGRSEKDVAADAGVVKIWGCKNLIFKLDIR